jgi:hypothetical protein
MNSETASIFVNRTGFATVDRARRFVGPCA